MNLCFIIGKVVSDIQFEFIINNKNISVAIFELELSNKTVTKVKGYNEIADICFQNLIKGEIVTVYGSLNNEMEIIINEIEAKNIVHMDFQNFIF